MFLTILFLIIGLVILVVGGEIMVRGSSSVAKKLKVKPLVIGLTVVAFGTSAPELVVNLFSAFHGTADIAIGNIIGSNIANIFLILGACALVRSLRVGSNTVWKEIPLALLTALLVLIIGNDVIIDRVGYNVISRSDGLVLMAFFIIFIYYTYGLAKSQVGETNGIKEYNWLLSILFVSFGILGLFGGGKLLVDNAVILARLAGMSEALIGLTIVAVGTSLPELVTSIIATYHGQNDIAIGNIVGSNIFNVLWILGLTSTILPLSFNSAVNFDIFVNVFATFLLFAFMFIHHRHRLNRWQGGVFIMLYVFYIVYLTYRG